jgi:hypothetical protein
MRWAGNTAGKCKKRKAHIVSVEQPDGNKAVQRQVSNTKINHIDTG